MFKAKAYGKINLSLEVVEKRPDSYHNIDTIMTRIDLFDQLSFEKTSSDDIIIVSDNKDLAVDKTNLIYKAWSIMKEFTKERPGIKVILNKNIPLSAGLAGGTSDGVESLKALNQLWNLGFSRQELLDLARPLGADSSFFFYDGLVRARGIGDRITKLKDLPDLYFILINIGKAISSGQVYGAMNTYSKGRVQYLVDNIDNFEIFKDKLYNSMEAVSFEIYPELRSIKAELLDLGADFSLMSGSGPTIFAGFLDQEKRDQVYNFVKDQYKYVFKAQKV
ncbi:MAG: 4-(cytidine 5'-diphospho)-2-C-methyl-D-erythritol kinase [Bacillota bacterium]|nr:4-(cytidine 5'-diphospho)-2-C-methyl-D-erythritol kinase [Bacillota bacterium]